MKLPNVLRSPRLVFCVLIILSGMPLLFAATGEGPAMFYYNG